MMDAQTLVERGDQLFKKRGSLLSLWQSVADQVYPERADFTITRSLGSEFADHLSTSYPIMLRRDLGNSFSAMLRSTAIPWFHMRADQDDYDDQPGLEWLERSTGVMRKAMYDRGSLFTRATKEGDHDFAAFGQCVLSLELNRHANGLLYRCWHLRDVAWAENEDGKIDTVHRHWKPTAVQLVKIFGDKVHPKVKERLSQGNGKPYDEISVRHVVMPGADYKPDFARFPFVSIFVDTDNKHVMEEVGQAYFMYVIPRWQTVSGSQYAFSPATVAALPDARLIQDMTRVLLEAGEKATNPPMVAVQEAIRSDVSIYAGGITWVDAAYDERLGEVLRPLSQDKSGIPMGLEMRQQVMAVLKEAFFLNTLTLPQNGPEMTAYEVGQRIQEYIRQAAPIFEPMEDEYNGALCEVTFELMLRAGAFGSMQDIPPSLRGQDVKFRFESPLHEAIERQKAQKFTELQGLFAGVVQVDPSISADVDFRGAFRDVVRSSGAPAAWLRSEDDANDIVDQEKQQEQAASLLDGLGAGAEVAEKIGKASQALGPEGMGG